MITSQTVKARCLTFSAQARRTFVVSLCAILQKKKTPKQIKAKLY